MEGDVSLHCHHQNDFCIKMGSDESHFNVSLIVRDKVTRQCPQRQNTGGLFIRAVYVGRQYQLGFSFIVNKCMHLLFTRFTMVFAVKRLKVVSMCTSTLMAGNGFLFFEVGLGQKCSYVSVVFCR